MAKRTKKQNRVKKRKETRKRKKAKTQSQPKLLRKNPVLKEALNYRHPLVAYLINKDWQEHKLASIYIIRKAPIGLVLSSFLVDIAGVGLKDAWGDYGLTEKDIEEVKTKSAANGNTLIPCDVLLVNNLVYGGIFWAKKWKFKLPKDYPLWLRLLEPVDKSSIKIDRFGENGKPVLFLDEDDLDLIIEREFDPRILEKNLEVEEDGLPQETLNRIGDIKAALIDFSRCAEFTEDFEAALNTRVGGQQLPKSEYESINFQDWFILQYELQDGKTVTQRFAEHYKKKLSDDVRRLLLGWETVIEGLFEVKDCSHNKFYMKNLINEREYTVFPTPSMENFDVKPGDFMVTRIVPTRGFHIFSGAATITRTDGSLKQRARMYKTALDFQMRHPKEAFKDNEEKLLKSRQVVREQYEDFMTYFGADEIFGSGNEILQKYQAFFDYLVFNKVNPNTGLTPAASYEQQTSEAYQPPQAQLPEDVLESPDVAMVCDPLEGLSFLIQYRKFIEIFEDPDLHLGRYEPEDLVLEYLESDSISDIPFRRVAQKFPDNFKKVMVYLGEQEGFDTIEVEDLMKKFKPDSFKKLPTTVTILDSEMTDLARLTDEESGSHFDRRKGLWKRIRKWRK